MLKQCGIHNKTLQWLLHSNCAEANTGKINVTEINIEPVITLFIIV